MNNFVYDAHKFLARAKAKQGKVKQSIEEAKWVQITVLVQLHYDDVYSSVVAWYCMVWFGSSAAESVDKENTEENSN